MRKTLKIFHTVGACGMVGALVAALVLIYLMPTPTDAAFADMRRAIALFSNYILMPSLGVVLVSGLLAMAAHPPYMSKGWALLKAGFGIIVFKGTLHLIGAHDDYANQLSAAVAEGTPLPASALDGALAYENLMIWTLLWLSIANVVVGVWRPRFVKESRKKAAQPAAVEAAAEPIEKQAA